MISERKRLDEVNPAYRYIGKENGYDMYVVPVRENKSVKKETNLDDYLLEDEELPKEYYNYSLDDEEKKDKEKNNYTKNDFFRMEYKDCMYVLYKQMSSLYSSLSVIQEVINNGIETR